MKTASVRAAISSTAAALLFAPVAHAAPTGDSGSDPGGCGVRCPESEGARLPSHKVDDIRPAAPVATVAAPETGDVLPLLAIMEKPDGSNHDQLVKLSTILTSIIDSGRNRDNPSEKTRQTGASKRADRRSDSPKPQTTVSTLAAVSGSTAYMDGIFNVGPGWRTITMPDGSKCAAGCNEVKWNYMTTTGKTGSAAAAGAWMDAHDTPDAVLYTFSGSAVGAQDARALRPDWQGKIIQLGSPSRPNNGATYEQGGRPVLEVGGGTIEYVSSKSDEAAVRKKWYGNHTFGYGGRDFSKETPLSETHYGDNVTDRVYADPPIRASWLTGLFTPKSSAQKASDESYGGKHRRAETPTTPKHVVKDIVDEVKKATTKKKKREATSVSVGSPSRSSTESGSDTRSED